MTQEELIENYGELLRHCEKSLDPDFDRMIESGQLTWRPWIGADWLSAEKRILIVGESHYAAKPDVADAEKKVEEWQSDSDGTREIVYEVGVGDWYASRFFGNLHRAFFGIDVHGDSRVELWRKLAFCNFIQRPMRDSGQRPRPSEFYEGWRYFMEMLRIIRPDAVIFVGVSAAKHFDGAMSALGIDHKIVFDRCQNGTYPCEFSAAYDGMKIDMVAIRHASQYFSWSVWQDYLAKKVPATIAYLNAVVGKSDNMTKAATSAAEFSEPAQTSVIDKLEGLPMGLAHKPVVACDYQDINDALGNFDSDDARFISVGHAQWNPDDLSVKMFRVGDSGRWSRQSEEVPAQRLPYMMAMLLATIYKIQNPSKNTDFGMNEKIVASQDMELLRDQIHVLSEPLKDGFKRVRNLLNMIELDLL